MLDFTFLFLNVHSKFGPETFRGCSHIPCKHSYIFLKSFETFKSVFFTSEHREHHKAGSTRYFPRKFCYKIIRRLKRLNHSLALTWPRSQASPRRMRHSIAFNRFRWSPDCTLSWSTNSSVNYSLQRKKHKKRLSVTKKFMDFKKSSSI